ncbi:MAG: OmpA family protein [Candidatus Hydrogenedentes bacterium]|nr:OmpA family protein [Candidatus Hydrogenedentota bacterium]
MTNLYRFALALFAAVVLMPAAHAAKCCQHEEMAGRCSACTSHRSGCCGKDACSAPTQWADPANVHWVHKGVSFGNYMKMAKAEPPAVAAAPPSLGPIYFDFDKAHLRPESVEVCHQLAAYLKAHPGQSVTIEGNCCDIGTNAYNKKLVARRAQTVKKFLVENGIAAKRIKTVSYGEERPKHGTDRRELNRRDDFVVHLHEAPK